MINYATFKYTTQPKHRQRSVKNLVGEKTLSVYSFQGENSLTLNMHENENENKQF